MRRVVLLLVVESSVATVLDLAMAYAFDGAKATDKSGFSVSGAGDVNGDGFPDVVIGAFEASPNGFESGEAHVVYGNASWATSGGMSFNLNDLGSGNGDVGIVLAGERAGDHAGCVVRGVGDFNGDGLDDVMVGAFDANAGAAYLVFGRRDGIVPTKDGTLELSSLAGSGVNDTGIVFRGVNANDFAGFDLSPAGDVNGDGVDDVLIGAREADGNGNGSGAAYLIYGGEGHFDSVFELSNIATGNGTTGVVFRGKSKGMRAGAGVSKAGDVNGDGIDDVLVGAPDACPNGEGAGEVYVIYGRAGGIVPSHNGVFELSSIESANNTEAGIVLRGVNAGDCTGFAVSAAGDVNHDGVGDVLIGTRFAKVDGRSVGGAYVVYGRRGGILSSTGGVLALESLNGVNGVMLQGAEEDDYAGRSVARAGDANGDGIDDILVGAYGASVSAPLGGEAYLIFGQDGGFSHTDGVFALGSVAAAAGSVGRVLRGPSNGENAGFAVAEAGDVNRDGVGDVLISAYSAATSNGRDSGRTYLVFGVAKPTPAPTPAPTPSPLTNPTSSPTKVSPITHDAPVPAMAAKTFATTINELRTTDKVVAKNPAPGPVVARDVSVGWILAVVGIGLFCLICIVFVIYQRTKRRGDKTSQHEDAMNELPPMNGSSNYGNSMLAGSQYVDFPDEMRADDVATDYTTLPEEMRVPLTAKQRASSNYANLTDTNHYEPLELKRAEEQTDAV